VLAYIAFAFTPVTREERVNSHKDRIFEQYADKQQSSSCLSFWTTTSLKGLANWIRKSFLTC